MRQLIGVGGIGLGGLLGACLLVGWQPAGAEDADDGQRMDPLGPNAACYVCHIPFVREELSRVHLKAEVACIECHGRSANHANDENIGATPPDVVYGRDQIDASCAKCHKNHNVPAREVVARFLERGLSPKTVAVCTDCHGTHRIEKPAEEGYELGQAKGASQPVKDDGQRSARRLTAPAETGD
jgi:hypothetical protein